jgi:hypothetical protein
MTTTLRDRIARIIDAGAFMPIANESNLDAYALGVAQRWKEKEQSKALEFADRIIAELGLAWRPIGEAGFTFDAATSTRWSPPCFLGRFDDGRWVEWVGMMDAGEWLSRDPDGSCLSSPEPTHFMPLMPAPEAE